MKNSKVFSVLFLIGQSGYIVAANNTTQSLKDYDYDMLLDKKFEQEALAREQARLQIEDGKQKSSLQAQVAPKLAAKNAKEEAEKAKNAEIVALQQKPANETLLTQVIHVIKKTVNQAVEKTEDTVFKVWVAYKVGTYLQTQKSARNPETAKEEAARLAEKLDKKSNAFVS